MGFFLERAQRDYVIFERSKVAGKSINTESDFSDRRPPEHSSFSRDSKSKYRKLVEVGCLIRNGIALRGQDWAVIMKIADGAQDLECLHEDFVFSCNLLTRAALVQSSWV